jgi:hypothetical protein
LGQTLYKHQLTLERSQLQPQSSQDALVLVPIDVLKIFSEFGPLMNKPAQAPSVHNISFKLVDTIPKLRISSVRSAASKLQNKIDSYGGM